MKITQLTLLISLVVSTQQAAWAQVKPLTLSDVEYATPVSNLKPAKELMVSWLDGNQDYIEELLLLVNQHNKKNPKTPPIRLVVTVPDNYGQESMYGGGMRPSGEPLADFKKWKAAVQAKYKIKAQEPIPYLVGVLHGAIQNPWMQDVGEQFNFKFKNDPVMKSGYLDTNYHGGHNGTDELIATSALLKFPNINAQNYISDEAPNDGDRGGNIEVTHENKLLIGNTISSQLLAQLKKITKQDPIIVNTQFLLVGHVDEIMTVVSAKNSCGAALLYADPLYAINLVLKHPGKYNINLDSFTENIRYFIKPSSKNKSNLTVDDFDLTKPLREINGDMSVDWSVLAMLKAARDIRAGVDKVVKASKCAPQVIALPVYLDLSPEFFFEDPEIDYNSRLLVPYRSPVNLLLLGSTAILEKPDFEDVVKMELGKVFGNNIHFVQADMGNYQMAYGSVHCSSNMMRIP